MNTVIKLLVSFAMLGLAACASVPPPVAESAATPETASTVGAEVMALSADEVSGYMQRFQQSLVSTLAKIPLNPQPVVQIINNDVLLFSLPTASSFEVNSGELRPAALATYSSIAGVLRQYNQSVVHVLAFANEPVDADLSMTLPNRQATAITAYWAAQGVPASRLRQTTRIADTAFAASSATGRVEIAIKPVVLGQENQAWVPPSLPTSH